MTYILIHLLNIQKICIFFMSVCNYNIEIEVKCHDYLYVIEML